MKMQVPLVEEDETNIFVSGTASTLDVERRHSHDKRYQTTKVTGCARASRNSILGRYLLQHKTTVRAKAFAEETTKSAARVNIRALAFRRRPDLFTRAKGRLRWERDVDEAEMSRVVHQGDEQALKEFTDANREDLEEELSEIRRVAKAQSVADHALPYSHDEWKFSRGLCVNCKRFGFRRRPCIAWAKFVVEEARLAAKHKATA